MNSRLVVGLCCATVLLAAGCSQQTISSAQHDAGNDLQAINKSAATAANDAKPQLTALDYGSRVTTAITTNANLEGTHIRVDASQSGVTLKGTVLTKQQRAIAGDVAKQTIPAGKSVENDLTVTPA